MNTLLYSECICICKVKCVVHTILKGEEMVERAGEARGRAVRMVEVEVP